MQTKKIKEIIIESNVRTDYGNIEELTASIKEKGIIVPLIITKDNILISGHRRLQAAKSAGLKEVPVSQTDMPKMNATSAGFKEIQLIENIQRKQMDPIEEGHAFKDYIETSKKSIDHLSKKIGKTKPYIERRISILDAGADVTKALRSGKISSGHAFVLARTEPKQQKKLLKEIINDKMGVEELKDNMLWSSNSKKLHEAKFDKKGCKECKYNGGSQAILTEVGKDAKGECLKPSCYIKKTNAWVKVIKKNYIKAGVKIFEKEDLEGSNYDLINTWDTNYKQRLKSVCNNPDKYGIFIQTDYSQPDIKLVQLIPDKKQKSQSETTSKADQKYNLMKRVNDWKREFLIDQARQRIKPGEELLKLYLYELISRMHTSDEKAKIEKHIKCEWYEEKFVDKLISLKGETIDQFMTSLGKDLIGKQPIKAIEKFTVSFGFDWKKDFTMTEEFLKVFTIPQLKDIAIEVGVVKPVSKKKELIAMILELAKPGYFPAIAKDE